MQKALVLVSVFAFLTLGLLGASTDANAASAFTQNAATVRCSNGLPEVSLSWAPAEGARYYRIQRKNVSTTAWSGSIQSQIKETSFVDTRWKADFGVIPHYYRIEAVRLGFNTFSTEVTVNIPDCRSIGTTPVPPPPDTSVREKIPSTVRWGAYTGWQSGSMTDFEALTNKKPQMEMVFVHWGNEYGFPTYYSERIRDKGRTMVLFWEATDYTRDPFTQPEFSLDAVNAGKLDAYFARFAAGAKLYGGPVIVIPYSEMNGNWYPWNGTIGNNTPEKLVAAYRRISGFFDGVPNVQLGWAPNVFAVPNTAANQMERYYPGGDVVDVVGVDGFNFGGTEEMTFAQLFDDSLSRLAQYNKPIYIFSTASSAGPKKAAWITDGLRSQLYRYPSVVGFLWFNQNKEKDWRVNSDAASLQAFTAALP